MGAVNHTQHTRAQVIEEFRRTGRVDLACAFAGVDRGSHYLWLKKHPDYAAEFNDAREQVAGLLEDEAVRRAYHGTAKPVAVAGKIVMLHEFSDQLLMFLLKARKPEVFADRLKTEHSGGIAVTISPEDNALL